MFNEQSFLYLCVSGRVQTETVVCGVVLICMESGEEVLYSITYLLWEENCVCCVFCTNFNIFY